MSRRRWFWVGGAVVALVVVGAVAIGWFGVHTLFTDDVVAEAGPSFDSGAGAEGTGDAAAGGAEGPGAEAPEGTTGGAPEVVTLASGMFEGVGRYSGDGTAVVLTDGTDQRFVRFEEDFSTTNGPDLFVYLGTGSGEFGNPDEYLELGTLRGNIGSQNYEIPAVHPETGEPVDLEHFDHVVVWCKRFDATFAIARLAA